jgi:starch synthase (maltosyl-transferring)
MDDDGRKRVVIEGLSPRVDGGAFPAKAVAGDELVVEADVFTDGHDLLACRLLHRGPGQERWQEAPMRPVVNDRWRASFPLAEAGRFHYTMEAWVDHFATWRDGLAKKARAGAAEPVDLLVGARMAAEAAARARGAAARRLEELSRDLKELEPAEALSVALDPELAALMADHPDRSLAVRHQPELAVEAERERAAFGAWYEMFPRSAAPEPGRHGTLDDAARRLDYVAGMGFDVVYLPPIHPIGKTARKGPNNSPAAGPEDVGSPWAIGSAEGGHKAVHPALGGLEAFRRFAAAARQRGLEVALDLAFQCSPDHPYVTEHPEWFLRRPDGSVQYAENPPKKYQDIYPFNFETPAWRELWAELESVVEFWVGEGVKIFRVDNPHTKPFGFWQWLIPRVRGRHPEVFFLAEAFTRPKVLKRLAKLGFSQSYNYFAWRNSKAELTEYFTELTSQPELDYLRPALWPNTPDILTEHLQYGGRPAFVARLVLAATLGATYGIYGPPFELMESRAKEFGSEEYLDSEKYQLRHWDLEAPSLAELIGRINRVRRQNPALQRNGGLRFHRVDNEALLCYSKSDPRGGNPVLVVVNLDPHFAQSGWLELDLEALGVEAEQGFQAHDQISGARFLWRAAENFVRLDPAALPAHIFVLRRKVRTERDFDYFM